MPKLFCAWILVLSFCLYLPAKPVLAQEVQVQRIAPQVYVHISFGMFGGTKVPANGLLVNTSDGVVMIDTAWDDEQTDLLLVWIKENLNRPVKMCVVTHAHDDRLGGIKTLQKNSIPVYSTAQTAQLAQENKAGKPDAVLTLGPLRVGQQQLEVYYPGAGHAPDNIVVYLPKERLLFGGCFVKDASATNLGNLADADVGNWAGAVEKVEKKFPKVKTVVPGHGALGDCQLLQHTKALVQAQQQK